MTPFVFATLVLAQASQAAAPGASSSEPRVAIRGQVTVLADALPRRDVAELRPQAAIEVAARASSLMRVKFEGFAEALVANRDGRVTAAAGRVREAWMELAGERGDMRVGYGRVIWGRLDEVQPSDVINPLNVSRYLFDGRNSARLPVTFLRGRWFASESLVVEGVVVPLFRRATFDELAEESSPFNLVRDLVLPASVSLSTSQVDRREPRRAWSNVSGGGRVSATIGRVDVAAGVFRGFDGFGVVSFDPDGPVLDADGAIVPGVVGHLVERFPRFTMISGDFETVTGEWAWRGEAAFFVDKTLANTGHGLVRGRALDAGFGFDRRTGEFRIYASAILHRERWGEGFPVIRTDLNVVGSIERQFSRDRYLARAFAVVNPADASGFLRGLVVWRARDNMALEVSAAAFVGTSDDTLGRFKTCDFVLVRWRVF